MAVLQSSSITGTLSTTGVITISKTGTLITHSGMSDAIGYNASYGTYIGSPVGGTYYIYANGQMNNNGSIVSLVHSGNVGSHALPISGGTLSGNLYVTNSSTVGAIFISGAQSGARQYMIQNGITGISNSGLQIRDVTGNASLVYFDTSYNASFGAGIWATSGNFSAAISASNISSGVNASHIVQRDGNGYIYANHINFNTPESENPAISSFITSNGDGWSRKSSIQHVRNQLGNYGGWITGYTETDTLNSVTSRGATTSNAVTVGLLIAQGPGGNYNENVRLPGSTAVISFNTSGATGAGSYNIVSQTNFQIRNAGGTQVFVMDQSGNLTMTGSMRAPIFYDSDDTGYYADFNSTGNSAMRVRGGTLYGPNPTWGAYLQVGGNGWGGSYASVVATNGNLHLDSAPGYAMYLNNYANGVIYFNGGSYYISSNGSYYNGRSEQVTINYNNDSNSTYQLLWGSGNNVYGTSQVYVNPSSDIIYARGGYISPGNAWGTGDSAFFPNGITTAGGTNWVYGLTYLGNAPANGSGAEVRANGSFYFRSANTSGAWGFAGQFVDRSNAANNYIPFSFENEWGNHSWGIVARFHIQTAGQDKPAIQFTSAGSNERWSLGYCSGSDFNFRITQNQGFRTDGSGNSDGWGTERFRINTDGNTLIFASLGIGSVTPDVRLSVNGDAHVSNIMYMAGTAGSVGSWGTRTTGYGGDWTTNARTVRFDNVGYGTSWSLTIDTGGNVQSSASMRAPIFYDSQDTGYYLDPGATSNLSMWTADTSARLGRSRYWTNRWAIYGTSNDYMTGTNGWGTEQGNWDNAWKGGFSGWDIWGTGTAHPQGGGYIHAQGIISGQHAASSDGGSAYGWMMVGAHNATENRYWLRGKWGGSTSGWVEMISSGNIGSQSVNYANSAGSAPANGGNSSTVGGYSVAVGGSANTIPTRNGSGYLIPENWIQLNGHYGLYAPINNMHIYPNDFSYGSVRIRGTRNGWHGMHFGEGNGITLMMNEGEFGFHREGVGWVARFTSGTGHFNISGNAATATDVYNLNFALGNTHYWSGLQYFRSNLGGYCGSLVNPPLQAYSDSNNSAFFSWHKGGHYAVNFGLDADNVLRIGGWSAAANRWQLDMSGNMTVAGDVTAYSDARVKENIITVDNALSKVLSLRGVYYNRTDSEDKNRKIGVIAQETMTVIPEVVNQDNAGMYNVSYGNIVGVLIEAIKEQQIQIEELKNKLDAFTK